MPWDLINEAIDARFAYNVLDDVKQNWVSKTNRSWDSKEDPSTKTLSCPMCDTTLLIPWTTCGADGKDLKRKPGDLNGSGYGDGELDFTCQSCACRIGKKLLNLAQFVKDSRDLSGKGIPMPGTLLSPKTGTPDAYDSEMHPGIPRSLQNPLTFPNRLVKQILYTKIQELLTPNAGNKTPNMNDVRVLIDNAIRSSRTIEPIVVTKPQKTVGLVQLSRFAINEMMNRYWDNFSPFALDLSGAVLRQGIFVAKMYKLDWLSSPVVSKTLDRFYNKYVRFLTMIRQNPDQLCVPTLDVDLAWHTHQLMPSAYYKTCLSNDYLKFIDHDDKVREDKLGEAFEWTSKTYQETFKEVYSECTCWYCETLRLAQTSSVSSMFSKAAKGKHSISSPHEKNKTSNTKTQLWILSTGLVRPSHAPLTSRHIYLPTTPYSEDHQTRLTTRWES